MTSHRDYQAGEIISISSPFVHVLRKEFKGINCDYCFVECKSNELGKCGRCNKMYYCGKECQQKDWIQHKLECKIYKNKLDQLKETNHLDHLFFRFVLRLNLYLKHNPELFYERRQFLNDENSAVSLNDIQNQNFIPTFHRIKIKESFLYMREQFQLLEIEWDSERMTICEELGREYGLDIFNYQIQNLGIGLYIAESQLKPFRPPSTKILFNGIQLVMRATKPIKTGEQITFNNFSRSPMTIHLEPKTVSIINLNFTYTYICMGQRHDMLNERMEFLKFCGEMKSAYFCNDLNEKYRIFKKLISFMNNICNEYDLAQILQKIIILETYVMIENDAKELSVAELAKKLEINLPSAYNEIFENIYFNQEEKPHVTVVKALANVEFNVKN
uniref:Histone-lysine N-methyltransferase SMYD3-like n=1 Tax=Dermatophagoides pteronyssinus TaxID=6956 RepID=A0A6P6YCE5_DERPT|nr:histone-lysine N-methyltransferase SMYD3-like [Dermatophagoides pteronyssinus]